MTRLGLKQLNDIRKKIGFLFQQAALYDSLSVQQNVAFPLKRHVKLTESECKQRACELLAGVGMEHDLEKLPSQLSGGMQKRVGLARALALEPEIILFDEPTAGLDPITATEIAKLLLNLKEKRRITAVVVTHDVPTAKLFSDRVLLLREGKVHAEGTFADLQKSRDEFICQFLRES
jgi:phospholipid/cholesterol/gamma-HCH transport system ATP-binding protein